MYTEQPELTRVDSAVAGLGTSPQDEKPPITKIEHRRRSSVAEGVFNIKDLEAQQIELVLPIETQKTGWKLNTSPNSIEDKDFPLGLEVAARNSKGVTIKDALDAIYKQFKKKSDDEMDAPYLAGFEWNKKECWTRLVVHQKHHGPVQQSRKKGKKAKEEA
ncbi:uncharacterized protein ASPGLDRAFT_386627 [Aspergillus glaucus CBS 516.65]|uniref:Uncharacterized protein n=1 Tax=Aspergillus glaucus CBS 516.65 TaxID=1160497 RepID=A0A1L9VHG8_ASPGL|nr:hypothetical protein ASPGLDRAFT_386627 [Aspergillus glaucus CBS 516.65]OJJ83322.1 hypothetical protein ASPGLDRAFT_386627 [Aspergillus glaucus CBS 516.65]